jgi:hypothetical protein
VIVCAVIKLPFSAFRRRRKRSWNKIAFKLTRVQIMCDGYKNSQPQAGNFSAFYGKLSACISEFTSLPTGSSFLQSRQAEPGTDTIWQSFKTWGTWERTLWSM